MQVKEKCRLVKILALALFSLGVVATIALQQFLPDRNGLAFACLIAAISVLIAIPICDRIAERKQES